MRDRRNGAVLALWMLATIGVGLGVGGQFVVTLMRMSPGGMYSVLGGADLDYRLLDQVVGVAGYALPALTEAGMLSAVAVVFSYALRWRRAHRAHHAEP